MSTITALQRCPLALAGIVCLAFVADVATAGRGGGGRGGGGTRTSVNAPSGGGGSHNVNNNANVNRNTNINSSTNIDRNTNINNNTNVNVNRNVNVDVDNGWDNRFDHPVAAGMAIGAAAAVIGTTVWEIPPSCIIVDVNGTTYQQCGSTWYLPQYAGSSIQYVVVTPPQ